LFSVLAWLSSGLSSGWHLFSLLGVILLGSGAVYWSLLYVAKVRSERYQAQKS
jgi:hypothetical protein